MKRLTITFLISFLFASSAHADVPSLADRKAARATAEQYWRNHWRFTPCMASAKVRWVFLVGVYEITSGCNSSVPGRGVIKINRALPWNRTQTCVAITHGMGHLFGFPHGQPGFPIMSATPDWNWKPCR